MEFDVLTGALGAEVSGLNLNEPLSCAEMDALHQGLTQHQVLFFRDQRLTPESHLALAAALGDVDPGHPVYPHVEGFQSIVELIADADNVPDTEDWHKDLTFRPNPPFASILRAVQVPSTGGDTLWANMGAVYESLSAGWRSDLQALQAIHDMGTFRNDYFQRGRHQGNRQGASRGRFRSARCRGDASDIGASISQCQSIVHPTYFEYESGR